MATKARQQYFADEVSLSKEKREFSIADEIQQKIDGIEEGAQVNKIETIKVNGTALIPDAYKAVDIDVPEVIDNLYTVDSDNALSAKQGKLLYDYIQNIASRGRFLSNWNSATGLPMTNPSESPYPYKSGDYFIVSNVAGLGGTNYRPDGSSYIIGQASTVVETDSVDVSDFYFYDGTNWLLLKNSGRSGAVDSSLSTTSTNPVENRVITNALNGKQETLIAGNNIQIAADGKTISATDTTYSAGANISIDANNEISAVDTTYTAGTNVQISNQNVISATDTKYTAGTGINIDANNEISVDNTIARVSDVNTKTFYLSSSSDLTNAQAAYDWYLAGKNPIISYNNQTYTLGEYYGGPVMYFNAKTYNVDDFNTGKTTLANYSIAFEIAGSSIINIGTNYRPISNVLDTDKNYTTPYTPLYSGSPATKKYVDDHDTIVSATAPSNPTEGMVWYDSTNDVLKTYDGTNWSEAGTKMVVLEYGVSTWQNFLDAYNKNAIVYCKASVTGGYRMAFLAYENTTSGQENAEFQYYRSRSSHNTDANQLDEVYIYKLDSSNSWTTTTRNTAAKIATGTGLTSSYNNSVMTIANDGVTSVNSNTGAVIVSEFTATNGGVKVFDYPSVNTDITNILNWINSGGDVIIKSTYSDGIIYSRVTHVETTNRYIITEYYGNLGKMNSKQIEYNSSNVVTSIVDVSKNFFTPSNSGSTGNVLTRTAGGYEWAAPAGGVDISSQANNILTSGAKLRAGTQADYEALGSYDSQTIYLTI